MCSRQLILEIISLLHGEDGNIRVGAAEILGVITPMPMAKTVVNGSRKHLDDNYIRDFVYGGFQGDEDDMRTVAECCALSIKKLSNLMGN